MESGDKIAVYTRRLINWSVNGIQRIYLLFEEKAVIIRG
jgi:hypothetical protein